MSWDTIKAGACVLENEFDPQNLPSLRTCFERHRGRLLGKIDHFIDVYEKHLAPFRGRSVRLLEIGVHRGGSLELWRAYFGEEAVIHGIDIDPSAQDAAPSDTMVHVGSQSDVDFLKRIVEDHGPFDIVIDDGSHLMDHQIKSFEFLFPTMTAQGLYICEDAFTSYWPEYGGGQGATGTFMEHAKRLIDELNAFWAIDYDTEPTDFTRQTVGIHFYSGAVVFQRSEVQKPVYAIRQKDGRLEISIDDLKKAAAEQG